jgi:hypothetical protein
VCEVGRHGFNLGAGAIGILRGGCWLGALRADLLL